MLIYFGVLQTFSTSLAVVNDLFSIVIIFQQMPIILTLGLVCILDQKRTMVTEVSLCTTTYRYRVTVYNDFGQVTSSPSEEVTTFGGVPTKPPIIEATVIDHVSIEVKWQTPSKWLVVCNSSGCEHHLTV